MTDRLKISRVKFCSGSVPTSEPLEVECPSVMILVGPNNSGKSRTLVEIESHCTTVDVGKKILVQEVSIDVPETSDGIMSLLKPFRANAPEGSGTAANHFWLRRPVAMSDTELQVQVPESAFPQWLANLSWDALKKHFIRFLTIRLDGRTRFQLVAQKPTGPLESHPQNHLWNLFVNDDRREKVRQFTDEAFGRHFVIDPTGMTTFRVRLSTQKPRSKSEEQSLDSRSRRFHARAPLATDMGDGVQTSVGWYQR